MIKTASNILFFADGAKGEAAALQRSYEIAIESRARLLVMDVVAEVSSDNQALKPSIRKLQNALIRERGQALDKLIASVTPVEGKKPSIRKVVVPGKDYVELVRTVQRDQIDLVVKSVDSHSRLANMMLGNLDLKILHHCPCPVLILKPSRRRVLRNVLAAVDPDAHTGEEQQLNREIMEAAASMATPTSAQLHVLHVLEKLGRVTGAHKEDIQTLHKALRDDVARKMVRLLDDHAHLSFKDHLRTGHPDAVIEKFIDERDIDLLVMGSVARSGVSGIVVGNTAEKILSRVNCSVMTLKPTGWQSPISGLNLI